MKNPIAVIDCAIKDPSTHCFNRLVTRINKPITYHFPSQMEGPPTSSLNQIPDASIYIIFGSASNICERLKWQTDLANVINEKLEKNIPVLGICFGHQLMADTFNCHVAQVDGPRKTGIRQFEIIQDGLCFRKGEKFNTMVYHQYEVKNISESFLHLGSSPECHFDMIMHKKLPFIGVQGHPEASRYFIHRLLGNNLKEDEIKYAQKDGNSIIDRFIYYFLSKY